jgi:hypothetical protein
MTRPAIAYVAEGKLYTQAATGEAKLVESSFLQGILDRVEKNRQRNEWKGGMAWDFSSRGMNPMAMNIQAGEVRRVRFTGVAAGPTSNEVLYTLDTDFACGFFHLEVAEGYERRVYHRNQFRASDLARSPENGTLAFAIRSPDGTAHIATMAAEGRGFKEITEGDAVDEAPSWVPGGKNAILFQSAGIGRNDRGQFTGLGPYAIHKIDLDGSNMQTILEEENSDVILPRQTKDGSLYFVRRPYLPFGNPASIGHMILDVVLFPFRLARAIVHFLNMFSLMFTKKPLMTAGGPEREGPDRRILMLYGSLIDVKKIQQAARNDKSPALVPATWVLACRKPDGSESILAKNVLAYDLCPDGSFVYSTGSKIFHVSPSGESTEIGKGHMIERVAVMG